MDNNKYETVVELLENYVNDEISLIFEYSGDFTKALMNLEKCTMGYIKRLNISNEDSSPILTKIRRNINLYNGT